VDISEVGVEEWDIGEDWEMTSNLTTFVKCKKLKDVEGAR
jgi:hypothetical protein